MPTEPTADAEPEAAAPETIATEEAAPAPIVPEPELEVEAGSSDKVVLSSRLDEAIALLRRPPAPEAVRFKIQTNPKDAQGSALIVTYIDSRFCSDRLNIVAPGLWSDSYAATPHGTEGMAAVLCRVKLTIPLEDAKELEIIRSDVGTSSGLNDDKGMKGLYSDAFKRACVKLGIGACIYAAPKQYLNASELGGSLEKPRLTTQNETKLRAAYARWLALEEVKGVFGVPLSHGDAAGGGQGDVEAEHDGDSSAPPPGFPLGEPANEKLVGQLGGALQFLLDDLELAGEVHGKLLERCGGYMPAAVAACIGIAAGAVKKRDEELAAAEAHAELDAAAAEAAGVDTPPAAEPEPEAEAAPVAADEPAAAPAAEDTTEGSTPA